MIDPTDLLGKQINHFRLDRFIAKGNAGLVFEAFDTALNRTVALKLIPTEIDPNATAEENAAREESRKRLVQEAMSAGSLSHPNIVTVHSYGETDEFGYICMEYVRGKSLGELLSVKKKLTPEEALPLFVKALLALEAAYQQQVVHRDITPSHIMIAEDGGVKVTDFGIAKLPSFSAARTGTVPDNLCYMSPERIAGQEVDIRSDLFSLGAVLFEAITGERPSQAASAIGVDQASAQAGSAPSQVPDAHVPAPLRGIIKKCMAENPTLRYRNPGEMIRDLRIAMRIYQKPEEQVEDAVTVAAAYMEGKTVAARPAGKSTVPRGQTVAPAAASDADALDAVTVLDLSSLKVPAKGKDAAAPEVKEEPGPKTPGMEHSAAPAAKEVGAAPIRAPKSIEETPPAPTPPEAKSEGEARPPRTTPPVDAKRKPESKSSGMRTGWIGALLLVIVIGAALLFFRHKQAGAPPEVAPAGTNGLPSVVPPVKDATSPASLVLQARGEMEASPAIARKLLEEALAQDPNNFEASLLLGRLFARSQDYPAALQQFEHALQIDNKSAELYFELGSLRLARGDYDSAIENFESCWALAPPNQDEVVANLGLSYLKKGDLNQAQVLFKQALQLNPNNLLARSHLELVGKSAAGPAAPQTGATRGAPQPEPGQLATQEGKQPQGSLQPSITPPALGTAPGSARTSPESLVLLAKDQMESDPEGAKKLLEDSLVLDPKNFEAMLQLGRLHTFQKNYDLAVKYYESALLINNRSALAYFNLGYIHLIQGNYDLAINSYSSCLALNPAYKDEALTNLGLCYLKKNNPTQATLLFQQALRLNPNNTVAQNYLQVATKAASQP